MKGGSLSMSDNFGRLKINSWVERMIRQVVFFPTKDLSAICIAPRAEITHVLMAII